MKDTDRAFPGSDDTRTIAEVDAFIKAANRSTQDEALDFDKAMRQIFQFGQCYADDGNSESYAANNCAIKRQHDSRTGGCRLRVRREMEVFSSQQGSLQAKSQTQILTTNLVATNRW